MNHEEATSVLARVMQVYRKKKYSDLVRFLDQTTHLEMDGPSGAKYQLEIQVVWDHEPNTDLRVIGSVDDGSWRALAPVSDSFILRPDGTFVGE